MTKLKLGIIGMSEGNGHPYSWSAICNGYSPEYMQHCPFPVIPQYLAQETWPDARIPNVEVTHVWAQDKSIAKDIAQSALIDNVCNNLEDMVGAVDAVLLARDDAEHHEQMAMPFLQAGIPIFIDKPLALSLKDANNMLVAQAHEEQLFSCSSLKFAKELLLTPEDWEKLGEVTYVEAQTPKYWNTYAVHLLDPIIHNLPNRGALTDVKKNLTGHIQVGEVNWQNLKARIATYGTYAVPLQFNYFGAKGNVIKTFTDSFSAFKSSIEVFVDSIRQKSTPIPRTETLEIVEILERGK